MQSFKHTLLEPDAWCLQDNSKHTMEGDFFEALHKCESFWVQDPCQLPAMNRDEPIVWPFDNMVVRLGDNHLCILSTEIETKNTRNHTVHSNQSMTVVFADKKPNGWYMVPVGLLIYQDENGVFERVRSLGVYGSKEALHDEEHERVATDMWYVFSLMQTIQSRNVELVTNEPPAKLNKKRRKSGKKPIEPFFTVRLNPTRKTYTPATAEETTKPKRKSPRAHQRRSHIRIYNRGEETQYTRIIPSSLIGSGLAKHHEYIF